MTANRTIYKRLQPAELDALAEAERFTVFCDGLEEAGLVAYARHGRMIARYAIRALQNLDRECTARFAMQEARDECLAAILATHAVQEIETTR